MSGGWEDVQRPASLPVDTPPDEGGWEEEREEQEQLGDERRGVKGVRVEGVGRAWIAQGVVSPAACAARGSACILTAGPAVTLLINSAAVGVF